MKNKLAIVVPYRNRESHLLTFSTYMKTYLKDYTYEIIVVNQSDEQLFNRGKLLNIGAKYAIDNGFNYICFHDVDMLPKTADYSYPKYPTSLISELENKEGNIFYNYFGGITLFNTEDFIAINGYSNDYWGWGYEDTDLFYRVTHSGLYYENNEMGMEGIVNTYLELTENDYLKIPIKKEMIDGDFTMSITTKIETKYFDENKLYDEYPIISIPGYNIGIFYNSFNRYFLQVYDENKVPYSITTDILDDIISEFTFIKKDNTITFKINGTIVGEIELKNPILNLQNEYLYIGSFSDLETIEFDLKVANITLNGEDINLLNVEKVGNIFLKNEKLPLKVSLPKPVRREGKFLELYHESNASINKSWVHQETRLNQIFFNNFVKQNLIDFKNEGLNTLNYKLVSETENSVYKMLSVEL
jgi:hypothetical protein